MRYKLTGLVQSVIVLVLYQQPQLQNGQKKQKKFEERKKERSMKETLSEQKEHFEAWNFPTNLQNQMLQIKSRLIEVIEVKKSYLVKKPRSSG